jgi:hypothetical protein
MSDQSNNNTEELLARQRKADALDRRFRRAAEDVSIYLTGGKLNAGTCLAVIEYAMGLAYWESRNPGKRVYRPEIYEPLLAGLAGVDDDLALEAASVYTANIGRWSDPEHYWPDPEDLLCYPQAAERTRKQVDKLTPSKRKKVILRRPGKIILRRPTS